MAATVPEAISRSIKAIKNEGVIDVTRGELTVLSLNRLYEIAMIEVKDFRYHQN